MSHLKDRLAEFVFEELPSEEMTTARRHVAQCLECQGRVSDFQKIRHSIEQLPDVDLPRRMVFVPESPALERPPRRWFSFAWAVPGAVAAALIVTLVLAGPLRMEWGEGGVRIALGPELAAPQAAPAAAAVDYDSLDYELIAVRIESEQQIAVDARLEQYNGEVARLIEASDDANRLEILRLQSDVASLIDRYLASERDTYRLGVALQDVQQTAGLE